MKIYRFESGGMGIYAAVDKACPKNDSRRAEKPDGSWLPKIGMLFPGAVSFWKESGLREYTQSGLRHWHESVVENEVEIIEVAINDVAVFYEDDYQVIGKLK